jgi:hypothetical protein
MTDTLPIQYLLMRNDMASQGMGRAAAQAAHAGNCFHHEMEKRKARCHLDEATLRQYEAWSRATPQGFGTTIVLGVTERQMRTAVAVLTNMGYQAGIVNDPTYVLPDGDTVHFVSVDTCGWVFMPDKKTDEMGKYVLQNFPLFGA